MTCERCGGIVVHTTGWFAPYCIECGASTHTTTAGTQAGRSGCGEGQKMIEDERCPKCDEPLEFDEVDIGVGVQRGNYQCPDCGWAPKAPPAYEPDDDAPQRKMTRQERLEGLADRGIDAWEDYRGER